MIIVKGFAVIPALASNIPGVVSAAGELSNKTRSYSKDIKIYNNLNVADEVSLHAFSIQDNGNDSNIPNNLGQQANLLLNWIFTYMRARGATQISPQVLVDQLISEYGTEYNGIEVGNFVGVSGFYLPSYVRFLSADGSNIEFRVWFSNSHFTTSYDSYTLLVIPPVLTSSLGLLKTTNKAQVEAAINALKVSDFALRVKGATDDAPFTEMHIEAVEWVNSSNTNERLITNWNIVIWGSGYSLEAIKEEIKTILLTASNTIDDWRTIFPSLFGGSVFKLTPYWDKHSIENSSLESSMYSPIVSVNDVINYAMRTEIVGNLTHVSTHAEAIFIPYKGLVMSAVGNADNANGYFSVSEMYSDYIAIPSTSDDVNRMSQRTQVFAKIMVDLAISAEVLSPTSQLLPGISRVNVGGILYATATLDGVLYMMVGRTSLPEGTP